MKSKEPLRFEPLKVGELSLQFLKMTREEKPIQPDIGFSDNGSIVLRYNDEKAFVEWYATRVIPRIKIHERISFSAFVAGVHSVSFYRSTEDLVDGVIDVKLDETGKASFTKLRIRSFKKAPFSGYWRRVKFDGLHARLLGGRSHGQKEKCDAQLSL